MKPFGIETFTTPVDDVEKMQYTILAALLERRLEFSHSRLYPALVELMDLKETLVQLSAEKNNISQAMPRQIKDVDWKSKKLVYENLSTNIPDIERMFELIYWALPFIDAVIEEGKILYDFVDENVTLEGVGIMPVYTNEGYFFVPEHRANILHILRYEMSLFTDEGHNYRAMRTNEIEQVKKMSITAVPEDVKLRLIKQHRELPNPATFVCETDLDFPYSETMLPVIKRKLMSHLIS